VERVVGRIVADQMKQGKGFTGRLNLQNKSITAEDCRTIAPALRTMTNLERLYLNSNNIGVEGCRTIAPALRTMPNLKNLYLDNNNIGDEGLAVLSNVVDAIPLLYELGLSGNKIGNVGCQCLLELIENDSLQSLRFLTLIENPNISSEELKTKFKRVWREKGKNPNNLHF
jgi:Ran GTPase-activating protein (RanGAP) involved in mRNA processing and transport